MALEIQTCRFACMDAETTRRLAVVQVSMPEVVDNLGRPIKGGLYDPAMGPIDRHQTCATCSLGYKDCPGHMGRIELPVPVYNPLLFKELYRLLRCKCFMCQHMKMRRDAPLYTAKLQFLEAGMLAEAMSLGRGSGSYTGQDDKDSDKSPQDAVQMTRQEALIKQAGKVHRKRLGKPRVKFSQLEKVRREVIHEVMRKCSGLNKCEWCGNAADALRKDGTTKIFRVPRKGQERARMKEGERDGKAASQEFLHAMDAERQIEAMWQEDAKLLGLLFGGATASSFFLHVLCVPPNRFRPAAVMSGMLKEHQQNISYGAILKASSALLAAAPSAADRDEASEASLLSVLPRLVELQGAVDTLFDSSAGSTGGMGIKQQLEKKEGLFRKHMMGKRVNFAARSVISPDPNIATHEIGIPVRFASKLTYPEPVTPYNVAKLRTLVENGCDVYPGANYIESEVGHRSDLSKMKREQRVALAKTLLTEGSAEGGGRSVKRVYRQLLTGDFLLVNRQPTLHKPGIMAHQARILMHDKVIRMHYANCNTYNADFDGDEMNLHFPQDELARAEALQIAHCDRQYLVPTDGTPLRGLIQDHVVSGVLLTKRDTFVTGEQLHQLLFVACQGEVANIETCHSVIPAILKPFPLYTGKQVVSCLLKLVIGDRPDLLNMSGKAKVPGSAWGAGLAGQGEASEEGTIIVRGGELLQGVLDKKHIGASEFGLVHCAYELYGATVAGQLLTTFGRLFTFYLQGHGFTCGIEDLVLSSAADAKRKQLQSALKGNSLAVERKFAGATKDSGKAGLRKCMQAKMMDADWKPRLDSMLRSVLSRASDEVRDACIPAGAHKLFPANCFTMMTISGAKGSVVNHQQITCQLGQQELEGARVPVMVSGKSLPCFAPMELGYRQGGYIGDRFLTGVRPPEYFFHCMSGREGLVDTAVKTSRSGYLQRCLIKHMEELNVNYDHTVRAKDGSVLQFLYGEDGLDVLKTAFMRSEANLEFLADNYRSLVDTYQPRLAAEAVETSVAPDMLWAGIENAGTTMPALAELVPSRHLGAVSEAYAKMVRAFCDKNNPKYFKADNETANANKPSPAHFEALMHLKYLRSLAEPGEPVGIIAGQSVGEPSTQMTLNTFHFAGVGGQNVTLGIPRLRELLMTASTNIKTPLMVLPLRPILQKTNLKEFLSGKGLKKYAKTLSKAGYNLQNLHKVMKSSELADKTGLKMKVAQQILTQVHALADEQEVSRLLGLKIPQTENAAKFSTQLANGLARVYLSSVLSSVNVAQKMEWSNDIDGALRVYTINVDIAPLEMYSSVYSGTDEDIQATLDGPFFAKLNSAIAKELKQPVVGVVRGSADPSMSLGGPSTSGEDTSVPEPKERTDKDDSDAEDADEEDASQTQHLRQRGEKESSYADDESPDEEDTPLDDDDDASPRAEIPPNEESPGQHREETRSSLQLTAGGKRAKVVGTGAGLDLRRRRWTYVVPVDAKERKLLMAELVQGVAKSVILKQMVPGVTSCLEVKNEQSGLVDQLSTEGVNLMGIRSYASIIDVDRIDSNDINAVLQTYGIEAARTAIIRQIRGVFGVYGIEIDPRHLNLIADYMTAEGSLRPFNRMGIDRYYLHTT